MSKVKYQQLPSKENAVSARNHLKQDCPCRSSTFGSTTASADEPFRRSRRWGTGKKPSRSTAGTAVYHSGLSPSEKTGSPKSSCGGNLFSKMVKQFARGETVGGEKTDLREINSQVARCRGGSELHAKKQHHVHHSSASQVKRSGIENNNRASNNNRTQAKNRANEKENVPRVCDSTSNSSLTKGNHGNGSKAREQRYSNSVFTNCGGVNEGKETIFRDLMLTASIPVDINENARFPGVCGIQNHGNTCFMNAILQCLSNSKPLILSLFLGKEWGESRRLENNIDGNLSDHLVVLLRSLWTGEYSLDLSCAFKNVVGKYDSQYEGSNQHDAQEFFLWLVDKVYGEVNTTQRTAAELQKVISEETSNGNRPARSSSPSSSSHIYDLFQGQLQSTLSCATCEKQSNTVDTFLSISLPVPHSMRVPLFVYLVPCTGRPRVIKGATLIPCEATIEDLRRKLSIDSNIPAEQLILTELWDETFYRTFSDTDPVALLQDFQEMYAIEAPKRSLSESREHLLLVCVNKYLSSRGNVTELPYCVYAPREATYSELQRRVAQKTWEILRLRPCQLEGRSPKLYVVDSNGDQYVLPHNVDHPLYTVSVDQALTMYDRGQLLGPVHVKLIVQWDLDLEDKMAAIQEDYTVESKSFQQLNNRRKEMAKVSLQDCFSLYFRKEKLDKRNGWVCQSCSGKQGMKQLSLKIQPDLFVVHLKRFKQVKSSRQRTKLHTLVEFPLSGLNMKPFVVEGNSVNGNSVPEPTVEETGLRTDDDVYDLYAVCSHRGDMEGGHYTAYCKNPLNENWYLFDDTKVTPVQEADITTEDAYILFYQHRQQRFPHYAKAVAISNTAPAPIPSPDVSNDNDICMSSTQNSDNSSDSIEVCKDEIKCDAEISKVQIPEEKPLTPPPPVSAENPPAPSISFDSNKSSKDKESSPSQSATRWYFTVTSV